nr:MAG TPA: hypothetical protein [Crassvirales sp.]
MLNILLFMLQRYYYSFDYASTKKNYLYYG